VTKIVEIEAPDAAVHCDAGTATDIVLTVTSAADAPFHLGTRLVPEEMTPGAWLSLSGPEENRLAPGETAGFTVTVTVPEDTPGRDHRFTVLFFDMAEPGERFVETPPIRFDAVAKRPEVPVAPPKLNPRRGWIVSALLGFAGMIAGLIVTVLLLLLVNAINDKAFHDLTVQTVIIMTLLTLVLTVWGARRAFPVPRLIVTIQMIAVSCALMVVESLIAIGIGALILLLTAYLFWRNHRETANPKAPRAKPDSAPPPAADTAPE
jgi:hypothetical protein